MSEQDLTRTIISVLNATGWVIVVRQQSGMTLGGAMHLAPAGWPDIVGWRVSDGRFVGLEVKAPAGRVKVSDLQLEWQERMKSSGCLAGVVRSVEEALNVVRG